ncbi:SPOR domain-containing protein [Hydrogenobaculum acidophilum]
MKLKRTALLSLGAFIGFTLFYIGLNQWQHEKESTGKINIVTATPMQNQAQSALPTTQPSTSQQETPTQPPTQSQPQTSQAPQTNTSQPNTTSTNTTQAPPAKPKPPQTHSISQKPTSPKTISQIIKNSQEKVHQNTYKNTYKNQSLLFQIGAFKSETALQNAIAKAKALGFEPIVTQQKGFYIVRVKLSNSQEGLKLLTAFPGAFRVR